MKRSLTHRQDTLFPSPAARSPIVVSLGLGVDSTAMLIGLFQHGERPDAILFADTGAERPPTYHYKSVLDIWLSEIGFPPITVVRYVVQRPRHGHYTTLEEECLLHHKLPSLAYGSHSCSSKWKAQPQMRWIKNWTPAQRAWANQLPVQQLIGFDASPSDQRRTFRVPDNPLYRYRFPLIEWGWDRSRCIREIEAEPRLSAIAQAHGLDPVPIKSSCFFCPASKPDEILWLSQAYPDYAQRIIALEQNAAPHLMTIEGLWRKATKTRPGSMSAFLTGQPLIIGTARPQNTPCAHESDLFLTPDAEFDQTSYQMTP